MNVPDYFSPEIMTLLFHGGHNLQIGHSMKATGLFFLKSAHSQDGNRIIIISGWCRKGVKLGYSKIPH